MMKVSINEIYLKEIDERIGDKTSLLHANRLYLYMSEKRSLIKGVYYV